MSVQYNTFPGWLHFSHVGSFFHPHHMLIKTKSKKKLILIQSLHKLYSLVIDLNLWGWPIILLCIYECPQPIHYLLCTHPRATKLYALSTVSRNGLPLLQVSKWMVSGQHHLHFRHGHPVGLQHEGLLPPPADQHQGRDESHRRPRLPPHLQDLHPACF